MSQYSFASRRFVDPNTGRPPEQYGSQAMDLGRSEVQPRVPQTEVGPGDGKTSVDTRQWSAMSNVRGFAIAGLVFAILAFCMIIAFAVWYWVLEDDISAKEIKSALGNSTEANARFKNLDVDEDTVLGTNSQDDLIVNASVSSNLVPDGNKTRSLGSSSRRWDDLYVDQVNFDGGVSIISETDYIVVDGQMGYKKLVKTITASGLSHSGAPGVGIYEPTANESGYLYIIEEDQDNPYSFGIQLPEATGSGNHYEFLLGTSVAYNLDDSIYFDAGINGGILYGSAYMASGVSGLDSNGASNQVTVFHGSKSESLGDFGLTPLIVSSGTETGVLEGSTVKVNDVGSGEWFVEGNIILNDGISTGQMVNPFIS